MSNVASLSPMMPAKTHARTMADVLERLGGISPDRVRIDPPLGRATLKDVIEIQDREGRLCELVDGILVEKAAGFRESVLACMLIEVLGVFVRKLNLGLVSGSGGMMHILPGLVRSPNVAFASWDRLPNRCVPTEPIPDLVPDLAVEVPSAGNTEREIARKRREYFEAGVKLVWLVDAKSRTVSVYESAEECSVLTEQMTLNGDDVLPGFKLSVREIFAELDRTGNR